MLPAVQVHAGCCAWPCEHDEVYNVKYIKSMHFNLKRKYRMGEGEALNPSAHHTPESTVRVYVLLTLHPGNTIQYMLERLCRLGMY